MNAITKNIDNLQRVITRSENPHPVFIICLALSVFIICYIIYITTIKSDYSGSWICSKGDIHKMYHNKWNDSVLVNGSISGYVKNNLIVLYTDSVNVGIRNVNMITWIDTKNTWHKERCVH